jgi:hypothetical protein
MTRFDDALSHHVRGTVPADHARDLFLLKRCARVALVTLPLALCGCQYLSHPFADDRPPPGAPILTVKDSVGVTVAPVAGVPDASGQALAEAMATALQDADVPATTRSQNRHSYQLSAAATADAGAAGLEQLRIHWVMRSHDGQEVGHADQEATVPAAEWAAGKADLGLLAKAEAPTLAAFVVDPPPAEHKPLQQIYVSTVSGAPGDGNHALPSALSFLLKRRGVPLTDDAKLPGTITIAGQVAVSPVDNDAEDRVQIAWHVLKPDGTDIGQIAQDNKVPHGSLDHRWGEVAMAVAMAGIDDILRVAATIPPASS